HTTEAIEQNDQAPAKKNKALFWVLGSFLVILLIAGGIVCAALAKLGGFERIEDAFPDERVRPATSEPAEGQAEPSVNVVLLGSDSRADTSTPLLYDLGNR